MEISCVRLIRDGNNTRHWFLIAMKLIWTIILTVVSTTTTCSNRWVSLIILLGRFAISPLSQPPARYTIKPRVTKPLSSAIFVNIVFAIIFNIISVHNDHITLDPHHIQGWLGWRFLSHASLRSQLSTLLSPAGAVSQGAPLENLGPRWIPATKSV